MRDNVTGITQLGNGHINDTFLAEAEGGKYVLQRIHKGMDTGKLRFDHELYSQVCRDHDWGCPLWIRDIDGEYFFTDENFRNWRCYPYIEGDIPKPPLDWDMLFSCGQGLAKMHDILSRLPKPPKAVFPSLHDLPRYYNVYRSILQSGNALDDKRDEETEQMIADRIDRYLSCEDKYIAVIHGDAKLSNMLFTNGTVTGFIDYDTVMTGSVTGEIADCIRSACVTEGSFDKNAAGTLISGYLSGSPGHNTSAGDTDSFIRNIYSSFNKICLELALRYYTDVISGGEYFREKYEGYRMKRVRELISVCRGIDREYR